MSEVAAGRAARIRQLMERDFTPVEMVIEDESARHAHHAGVREAGRAGQAGETHFALTLVSARFEGLTRVERQRLVHEALAAEFRTGLPALSLRLRAPAEPAT